MIDLRLEEQKEGNAQRKRNYLDFLDMLLQAKVRFFVRGNLLVTFVWQRVCAAAVARSN